MLFYHFFCLEGLFLFDQKKTKKQVNCWHPFSVLLLNVLLCNQNLKDKIDWWMYLLLPCSIDRPLVTPYLITGIDRAVFEGGGLWPQTLLWIAWLSLPSHQGSHTAFAQPCHTPISSRLLLFMKSTLTDYYLKCAVHVQSYLLHCSGGNAWSK